MNLEVVGFIAALFMIFHTTPQLYKTITKKTVDGLSVYMLFGLLIGCVLMNYYVFHTSKDIPLLLNYSFNILIVSTNIGLYFRYKS